LKTSCLVQDGPPAPEPTSEIDYFFVATFSRTADQIGRRRLSPPHSRRSAENAARRGVTKYLPVSDELGIRARGKAAIAGVNEPIASIAAEQSIVTQDMSNNLQRASAELS
jgi:hypothetical protein